MIEDEFEKLLNKEWLDEERELIKTIKEGIMYYKKLIPKGLRSDVIRSLQLCNQLKEQLELLSKRVEEYEKEIPDHKETVNETDELPGETVNETEELPGETVNETEELPGETVNETEEIPGEIQELPEELPGEIKGETVNETKELPKKVESGFKWKFNYF